MTTEGVPSTTLTAEDCATLRGYFTLKQHEFLNSNAYITEAAITTRIEDVDPAWTFEILNISNRDAQVTALGRLTIKGVSRDGIGMAKIAMTRDGKGEANEAEKSAATDALKRAARLFGIGRYLLDMENVTDASSLTRWFNQQQNPPTLNVVKTDTGAKVETPLGAGDNRRMATTPPDKTIQEDAPYFTSSRMWVQDLESDLALQSVTLNRKHLMNVIDLLKKDGAVTETTSMRTLVALIVSRERAKAKDEELKPTGT